MEDIERALVTIIQHCPNLEIFVIERPMGSAFGPVADALANHAYRKLHTVQWNLPGEELAKVIWALNSLPRLVAAHIDIETNVESSQELAHLGSASNLSLMLPCLQQLSLRGYIEELVEQATGVGPPGATQLLGRLWHKRERRSRRHRVPARARIGARAARPEPEPADRRRDRARPLPRAHHAHLQRGLAHLAAQRHRERARAAPARAPRERRTARAGVRVRRGLRGRAARGGPVPRGHHHALERPQRRRAEPAQLPAAKERACAEQERAERLEP